MTIDPYTTPAEAEREARSRQARDFLALAMKPENLVGHEDGVQAVRDALVGQGYALTAIHAELADIAASLRTLATLPSAVRSVADQVHDLTATLDVGVEFADASASALQDLVDVADRPRWWQWRLRRALRQTLKDGAAS